MNILGNKICYICGQLNSKRRKDCFKCGLKLRNTIKNISAKPYLRTKKQFEKNEYIFTCSEVEV